jgi:hypothetical protein
MDHGIEVSTSDWLAAPVLAVRNVALDSTAFGKPKVTLNIPICTRK